jgi:predicted patatin/cPLA2 family phospholipase
VVLTRNKGYRKETKDIRVPSFIYRKYPRIREALNNRSLCYNKQLEMVEALEKEGRVQVIRPLEPVNVDRIERNVNKLTTFYEEGYRCAEAFLKLNK